VNTKATALGIALAVAYHAASPSAHAEVPPSYGYEFVTVGDPGNRDTKDDEGQFLFGNPLIGGVDYTYRIARTETTIAQWIEFAEAYAPFYQLPPGTSIPPRTYSGQQVTTNFGPPVTGIRINGDHDPNEAVAAGWEFATRYCNWLHNGKVNEAWAFESGAYDTSTFTYNDDGSANHQAERSPGARFWLPSIDEWTKAAYWDPDKNGPGVGGYWQYPNGSDTDLIPDLLPEDGGERNAGPDGLFPLPVGSFPHVPSPWGVLDMAGGQWEWVENVAPDSSRRFIRGSIWADRGFNELIDRDRVYAAESVSIDRGLRGVRIASAVPSPGPVALVVGLLVIPHRRRA
jgi:formylglycine-generating enzyme required for sulfatase activity